MAKRILLFLSETCLHVWAEDGKRLTETGQFKPGEEGEVHVTTTTPEGEPVSAQVDSFPSGVTRVTIFWCEK